MPRVVHLALADARGHLMRAHLLRQLLGHVGIEVTVVTTQDAGAAFLASLGTPSTVLPGRMRMELDGRHQLLVGRTRRRLFRYALADLRKDTAVLASVVEGAALVVNDSFHPALLAAHHTLPRARVVHVHGDNLKATVKASAQPLQLERWLAHGFAEIVHTLAPITELAPGRVVHLPPLVAALARSADEVRAALHVDAGQRVAAVYLNPHYQDPAIAALVERACERAGLVLRGVSEAFAQRPGWCAADPGFIDVVAAANVFISGAGMGALEQARVTGTPLVCLLGRQQEQTRNVSERGLAHVQLGAARDGPQTEAKLVQALAALPEKRDVDANREIARVHALWTTTFVTLLKEASDERPDDRTRDRNQQPARRERHRRRLVGPSARAFASAEPTALVAG